MAFSSSCQAAPLSHLSSPRELGEAVEQLGAHHILCSVSMFDTVSLAVQHLPVQVHVLEPTPERFVGAFRFGFVQDDCCSSTNSSVTALGPSSGSSTPPRGKYEDSAGDRVALVLRTSGTTSTPKICPLRMADIVNNGGMIAQALHLTDADVCINAMPLFHIGGLSASVLATIASGGSVLCMRGFKPQAFIEALWDAQSPRPTW
jgi:acyl-CoA synthetase (AMP-forming)/AMP-acid ligase II